MGGVDKGLQLLGGVPLALHALRRLAPQVGPLLVNANRHLDDYAALGVTVCRDGDASHPGPLAGFLAGLEHCTTPYLVSVPCDAPAFPENLVARLCDALERSSAEVAVAATTEAGVFRLQPVFCLMRASVRAGLTDYLAGGGRAVHGWVEARHHASVSFDDATSFINLNTADDLHARSAAGGSAPTPSGSA